MNNARNTCMRFPFSSHAWDARRGLTLIELLVVIAILAILAAVLLPALARAKALARRVECVTRQKQWALALISYSDDNEGWMPREGFHRNGETYPNNWANVQDRLSADVWYNALSNYVGCPAASSYARPSLIPDFYARNSLFHCPSAPFRADDTRPVNQTALFSMAMNSQLITAPRHAPQANFTRIKPGQSAQTVLFLDNILPGEEPVDEGQDKTNRGQPAAYANRFAGVRHYGRTGVIAFADGHTEAMLGTKVVQTEGPYRGWAIEPPIDVIWEPDE